MIINYIFLNNSNFRLITQYNGQLFVILHSLQTNIQENRRDLTPLFSIQVYSGAVSGQNIYKSHKQGEANVIENTLNTGFAHSDLACEGKVTETLPETVKRRDYNTEGFSVTELEILVSEGENGIGCPAGRYVTIDIGKIWMEGDERLDDCIKALSSELSVFIKNTVGNKETHELCMMIAGLGNRFITADSLGPLTVDKLTVTRHMMGGGGFFDTLGCSRLCAIQPGVLGQTGIEAAAIIKGAVEEAKPDVVIAVDALAARSTERLATTVQLSDGGICPGSGIGNRRVAINEESVGCPVIAIGVPTVVDSSTLVWDALEKAGVEDICPSLHRVLENGRSFFVSLKESDVIIEEISSLLSSALSRTAGLE